MLEFFKRNNYLIRESCSIYISIAGVFCIVFGALYLGFSAVLSNFIFLKSNLLKVFKLKEVEVKSSEIFPNVNPRFIPMILSLIAIAIIIFGILELIWGLKSYNAKYNPNQIFTRSVIIFLANVAYLIFYQRQILTVITAIVVTIFLILSYYYKIGEIPIIEQEKNGYYIPKD